MKTSRNITLFISILAVGISAALMLRAQETAMPVQDGAVSLTDTNVDWNSMSDLEVELKAIESVPPMPADSVPQAGTFWSAQHAPGSPDAWPPLPGNIHDAPAWDLGDGVFLLSDLNFDYNPPVKFSLNGRGGMMMDAMDSGPGGDGSDSGDGGVSPFNAPNYGTNLWLLITGVSNSFANLFLENTEPAIQYEIQSKQDLTVTGWVSEGFVLGSELTNWTPMNVAQNGRTNLFFRIRSWADDGSGLPIWWQLQYFGTTGINPNALDSAGDGWTIYQKYQMGLNPNVFYTPPAPQGMTVAYNIANGTVTVSWQPSPGAVTSYTVNMNGTNYNVSSGTFSFENNASDDNLFDGVSDFGDPTIYADFQVQANYAGGSSAVSDQPLESYGNLPTVYLIPGSQSSAYLAAPALPAGTVSLRITRIDELAEEFYGDSSFDTNFDIPVSAFTNGLYLLPTSWEISPADSYGFTDYEWWVQTIGTNDNPSAPLSLTSGYTPNNVTWLVPPFFDGREQLKQNLNFLFRVANVYNPFQYNSTIYPANYAYAGLSSVDAYSGSASLDVFRPFTDNYLFRNFVFSSTNLDSSGVLTTGVGLGYSGITLNNPPEYLFVQPTNIVTIPAILDSTIAQWTYLFPQTTYDDSFDDAYFLSWIDISYEGYYFNESGVGGGTFYLTNNTPNLFGLPFVSTKFAYSSGGSLQFTTLSAGGNIPAVSAGVYPETAQPQFQTAGYNFWDSSPVPGMTNFSPSQTSDLLIAPVGNSISINGYAKLAVTNGYSGVYGYLGQYFDQAYQITNGIVTTNATGVLSPYGNFFATQPGSAALVTMPDPDTGARGTCAVYCVSLALDRNHDGNMDLSFSGTDATSASSPYTHWCDNNYDRFALDEDDGTNYQDDVQVQDCPYTPNTATPDCNYRDMYGNRVIPDTRDLEDYARLWVSGITSNLLAALPAGSTVTLNWGDVGYPNSGNPTIDLFQAVDPVGGIGYLTNETVAAEQINPAYSAYVGRLAPGGSIQLNASFFSGWAGNHYIWCGVTNGSGQLNLTIADASGNVLAQASQWIQIVDIKQMYERWTVGDNLNNAPATTASLATEDLPVGASAFQYAPPQGTNTPYILFVHGWNMESWEKDRFAETAFKRLYWQGYQGRFGEFRWPTGSGFTGNFGQLVTDPQEKDNFDNSEYNAWLSGTGLLNKLNDLNAVYPGHIYVLAHSMGNIVTGTALRLAGTTQVVNTYVASQAAVTAHAYDETVPNYSFNVTVGGVNFNLGPNTPNIYGDWFTNNNGGGAGQVINFYNTNDFALSQLHWQLDQLFKPDMLVAESGSLWNYGYSGSNSDPAPWNHFFKTNTVSTTVNFDIVGNLTNRYEVMSYAAQSYTTALGATPGVHHVAANIDLTTLWPSPDPLDNNYASHFYHSAEFRGDSVWEWNYWNTLLFSSSSGFNISSP